MEIHFAGVGEACDELLPNTSLIVRTAENRLFLLDCGFTAAHRFFALIDDANTLDCVWVSHFHGDHFFGLPLLLLRFWEQGRRRPLLLAGPHGLREKVIGAMELAYPGFLSRLAYAVDWKEAHPRDSFELAGSSCTVAPTTHSQPCLAVRIDDGCHRLFYSGDGRPTQESAGLAVGCDLVVHEAFSLADEYENHGSVASSIALAEQAKVPRLALVHLCRRCRRRQRREVEELMAAASLAVTLPEPGDCLVL